MDIQEQRYPLSRRRLESVEEDRCVCAEHRRSCLKLTFILAEGNPDEEKIGAFGVG